MARRILACVASLAFAIGVVGLVGCSGDPDIPEGYSEKDIRQPAEGTMKSPAAGLEAPEKAGGG